MVIYFDGGWDMEGFARPPVVLGNVGDLPRMQWIGRTDECQIHYGAQLKISRKPVAVGIEDDGRTYFLDTGATNGVFFNDELLPVGQKCYFEPGVTKVRIGNHSVHFHAPLAEALPWTAHLHIKPTTPEERELAVAAERERQRQGGAGMQGGTGDWRSRTRRG